MLKKFHTRGKIEAGCDEAGRGCLAGPVFAAAVILPPRYKNALLNDSKQLNKKNRDSLRIEIEKNALAWAVARVEHDEIDEINILNASIKAMKKAVSLLAITPELLLIDGNRFHAYEGIPHHTIIKGDGIYMSIAAASVLAKTHRDDCMEQLHEEFPQYDWKTNKGYPTAKHRTAIYNHGISPYYRRSFNMSEQLKISF
ncbi:MAG: ribonuclease HII [Bacteroidota bacterium]